MARARRSSRGRGAGVACARGTEGLRTVRGDGCVGDEAAEVAAVELARAGAGTCVGGGAGEAEDDEEEDRAGADDEGAAAEVAVMAVAASRGWGGPGGPGGGRRQARARAHRSMSRSGCSSRTLSKTRHVPSGRPMVHTTSLPAS